MIKVYTDGGISMKNKVGGWAAVILYPTGDRRGIKGAVKGEEVTNNTMEFKGAIEALKYVAYHHPGKEVTLFSDSEYLVKGINSWIHNWIKKGWRTTTGEVKNIKYWQELLELKNLTNAKIQWVRGHAGNINNEIADKLAVSAYKELIASHKSS